MVRCLIIIIFSNHLWYKQIHKLMRMNNEHLIGLYISIAGGFYLVVTGSTKFLAYPEECKQLPLQL